MCNPAVAALLRGPYPGRTFPTAKDLPVPVYNDLAESEKRMLQGLTRSLLEETPARIAEYELGGERSADGQRFSYPVPESRRAAATIDDFGR